ncbi:heparan-alpha-glucosaminide N-acetyltransferase domain-containing protein [Microbacterium sp. NPDC096154]|uniref:heparan-alpha-glucosaminide N-acetyltransferase domain-containing protein n=1 Tax=Microbacterium sp. NPDC096154 TaxID=3155549 RepID=UPI00332DC31F
MAAAAALRERISTRRARLDGPGREPGIDLARGLAVIGMFAAHLLDTSPFEWAHPATWTDVVNGRSSILFATLAGVSLALVTGGRRPFDAQRMAYARIRIALRAACIWLLGILLILLQTPVLVILPAYAILFLLALPLLRAGVGVLFGTAGAIAIAMPFAVYAIDSWDGWHREPGLTVAQSLGWNYPFLLWAAFVVAGIGIGRLSFSQPLTATLLFMVGVALAMVGYEVIGRWALIAPADSLWGIALSSVPHSSGMGEAVGSGGVAILVIALCALLCATPARWIVWPLRAVGAMPLTAYTAQLVAWAALQPSIGGYGSELAAFRATEPFWPMTIATIVGCTVWTLLVGRGPLERLVGWVAQAGPRGPALDDR